MSDAVRAGKVGPPSLVGRTFGELTVERLTASTPRGRLWECRCNGCGRIALRTTEALNRATRDHQTSMCQWCRDELFRGLKATKRERRKEKYRSLWEARGELYASADLDRIESQVAGDFEEQLGLVLVPDEPDDFEPATGWPATDADPMVQPMYAATLREIGAIMRCNCERIRQIEQRAINKLRSLVLIENGKFAGWKIREKTKDRGGSAGDVDPADETPQARFARRPLIGLPRPEWTSQHDAALERARIQQRARDALPEAKSGALESGDWTTYYEVLDVATGRVWPPRASVIPHRPRERTLDRPGTSSPAHRPVELPCDHSGPFYADGRCVTCLRPHPSWIAKMQRNGDPILRRIILRQITYAGWMFTLSCGHAIVDPTMARDRGESISEMDCKLCEADARSDPAGS